MNKKMTRRVLVRNVIVFGSLMPTAGLFVNRTLAQSLALDPNDATAKSFGYVTSSTKPDSKCGNCSLFQGKVGAEDGPCAIFPGKSVAAAGWCRSWVKKVV